MKHSVLIFLFSFSILLLSAQEEVAPRDTTVEKIANQISKALSSEGDFEKADSLVAILYEMKEKGQHYHALWRYYHGKGYIYYYKDAIDTARMYFDSTLQVGLKINDTLMILGGYQNRGAMYQISGQYDKALQDYISNAEVAEMNKSHLLGGLYGNIGMLYQEINHNEKAIEYLNKAIEIYDDLAPEDPSIIKSLNVLGNIYKNEENYDKSKLFYMRALEIGLQNEDLLARDLGDIYINLSELAHLQNKDDERIEFLDKALSYYTLIGSKSNVFYAKMNMMDYFINKNMSKAKELLNEIEEMKASVQLTDRHYHSYLLFKSEFYFNVSDFKNAYISLREATDLNDSITKTEKLDELSKLEMRFSYEQQLKVDSLKQIEKEKRMQLKFEEEKALKEAQLSKQRLYSFVGIGGSLSLLVIALILFRNNKAKTKAHELISNQKMEIEEKQTEILDSINYAQKIQNNILPPIDRFNKISSDFFLLFMPKDIVSGDFYWFEEEKDLVFFAVADCTGHGVPGAMVSMVCSNALSKVVKEEQMISPGIILDRVKAIVSQQFKKSDGQGKDGMDISLCCWNPKSKTLSWSGANNPLWLIEKGSDTITSITPDKQPIGHSDQTHSFTTHELQIQEGDTIYLFSDGYQDQFGGAKEKKLKTKGFKNIIQEVHNKEMGIQKETLETKFNQWKGDLEQLDDVCVIGIRF